MAVAVIGLVLCVTVFLNMPSPFFCNQVKMVEDDLAYFPPKSRREVVRPILFDLINFGIEPEFALAVTLPRVNVQWLVPLIRVKEEPPTLHQ
jgi:hypothetical protein